MALGAEIKVRVSMETKIELAQIAESKGEGVKISDVVRDAISDFLRRRPKPKPKPGAPESSSPSAEK